MQLEALLKSHYLTFNLLNLFIASLFSVKPSLALLSLSLFSRAQWTGRRSFYLQGGGNTAGVPVVAQKAAKGLKSVGVSVSAPLRRRSQSEITAIAASGVATGAGTTAKGGGNSTIALGEGGEDGEYPFSTTMAARTGSLLSTLAYGAQ